MALYLISYELAPGQDDAAIVSFLEAQQGHRTQDTLWLVQAGGPAEALRNVLSDLLETKSMLVIQLKPGADWATRTLRKGTNDWLKTNVAP